MARKFSTNVSVSLHQSEARQPYLFVLRHSALRRVTTVISASALLITTSPPQLGLFIELKAIELRVETTEANAEGSTPLEAAWNQEPLDHTRHQEGGRLEFGCAASRADGVEAEVSQRPTPNESSFVLRGGGANCVALQRIPVRKSLSCSASPVCPTI